ncbi:MAG: arylsulfatase [Myxococcales bacterium]|nr:arylsulfatase [Myxococcales bacterium]
MLSFFLFSSCQGSAEGMDDGDEGGSGGGGMSQGGAGGGGDKAGGSGGKGGSPGGSGGTGGTPGGNDGEGGSGGVGEASGGSGGSNDGPGGSGGAPGGEAGADGGPGAMGGNGAGGAGMNMGGQGGTPAGNKLNVVLVLSDDQGCGDFEFTGNQEVKTPTLNALAASGVRFDSFRVSPLCSPTRASLLTGRYHQRTGVFGVVGGNEYMAEDEVTVAEVLKTAGYRTALLGKWHLGENYPLVPHAQGFDEFYGFRDGSNNYFNTPLEDRGTKVNTNGYLTDVLTDRAIKFVEDNKTNPFFLYLAYNAPHGPFEVPAKFLEAHKDVEPGAAAVYGMVESMDENLGRVFKRIDDLGLGQNTVVLFTSDNGPISVKGDTKDRFNCGQRDWKYSVFEGGVRVPLLARLPGKFPAGKVVKDNTAHIDIMPTILDLVGLNPPANVQIDGTSLKPLLMGTGTLPERTLFMQYPGEQSTGREAPFPGGYAIKGDKKLVHANEGNGLALFDLSTDRGETMNLVNSQTAVRDQLDAQFKTWWSQVRGNRKAKPPIPVGYPQESPTSVLAHPAKLSGGLTFRFRENPPAYRPLGVHGDWIGKWTSVGGTMSWPVRIGPANKIALKMTLRCPTASNGSVGEAKIGNQTRNFTLSVCAGTGNQWREQPLGEFAVSTGATTLTVTSKSHTAGEFAEVRSVEVSVVP